MTRRRIGHGGKPSQDGSGGPPDGGQERRLTDELESDVDAPCAEGAALSDLASPFEDRDQHDIGDAHPPNGEGDGSESQKQALERGRCRAMYWSAGVVAFF